MGALPCPCPCPSRSLGLPSHLSFPPSHSLFLLVCESVSVPFSQSCVFLLTPSSSIDLLCGSDIPFLSPDKPSFFSAFCDFFPSSHFLYPLSFCSCPLSHPICLLTFDININISPAHLSVSLCCQAPNSAPSAQLAAVFQPKFCLLFPAPTLSHPPFAFCLLWCLLGDVCVSFSLI